MHKAEFPILDVEGSAAMTVGQWVARYPQTARVFENRGIDYCCGGKRSIEAACAIKGQDPSVVRAELAQAMADGEPEDPVDWGHASLEELVAFIEVNHHGHVRRERARITALAEKVARVHGARHPELVELSTIVGQMFTALDAHFEKEHAVLFAASSSAKNVEISEALADLEAGNAETAGRMASIRKLTAGFQPPQDACNSFLALFHGLQGLEANVLTFIHVENNILFVRLAAGKRIRTEVAPKPALVMESGTPPAFCCDG